MDFATQPFPELLLISSSAKSLGHRLGFALAKVLADKIFLAGDCDVAAYLFRSDKSRDADFRARERCRLHSG